jgi:PRTRC genetic system protein B
MQSLALLFTPIAYDRPLSGDIRPAGNELVVTRHEITENETGPIIGPGIVLTLGDKAVLRHLLDSDEARAGTQWIPSNLLQRSAASMTWFRPGETGMMYFSGERRSHFRTRWPSLVFHAVEGGQLRLAAYLGTERPGPTTMLFHAPLWNVYSSSALCTGSADVPQALTVEAMAVWEAAVYRTRFSHENHANYFQTSGCAGDDRAKRTKAYMRLLRAKGRENADWTAAELIPMNESLGEWVERA